MTVAEPLPPEALALLPVPLVLPVLEELDGLLLHAAVVAAASASRAALIAYRVLFAALLIHSLHCRAVLEVACPYCRASAPVSGTGKIIKDAYDPN